MHKARVSYLLLFLYAKSGTTERGVTIKKQSNYILPNHSMDQYTLEKDVGQTATITKRIGSTNYRVHVRFSETSSETLDEKMLRMAKREVVE